MFACMHVRVCVRVCVCMCLYCMDGRMDTRMTGWLRELVCMNQEEGVIFVDSASWKFDGTNSSSSTKPDTKCFDK